tara:strand:+ start:608 stop:1036 length:429 start_codon:yes stop_codon:yes gene_type:complete
MKKIGSHTFYGDVDLELKFNFEDIMDFYKKNIEAIKDEFFDENGVLQMDTLEEYVEGYVNEKVKEKFGDEFYLDVMDDTMNISWNVKVDSIKKKHVEEWWDKENLKDKNLKDEKPITLTDLENNPSLISELPDKKPKYSYRG